MLGADDRVAMSDMSVPGNASISAGTVSLRSVEVERGTTILSKRGPASVTIDDSTFNGAVAVRTGSADRVAIEIDGDPLGARACSTRT